MTQSPIQTVRLAFNSQDVSINATLITAENGVKDQVSQLKKAEISMVIKVNEESASTSFFSEKAMLHAKIIPSNNWKQHVAKIQSSTQQMRGKLPSLSKATARSIHSRMIGMMRVKPSIQ